jgi:hypothetical protein
MLSVLSTVVPDITTLLYLLDITPSALITLLTNPLVSIPPTYAVHQVMGPAPSLHWLSLCVIMGTRCGQAVLGPHPPCPSFGCTAGVRLSLRGTSL